MKDIAFRILEEGQAVLAGLDALHDLDPLGFEIGDPALNVLNRDGKMPNTG